MGACARVRVILPACGTSSVDAVCGLVCRISSRPHVLLSVAPITTACLSSEAANPESRPISQVVTVALTQLRMHYQQSAARSALSARVPRDTVSEASRCRSFSTTLLLVEGII